MKIKNKKPTLNKKSILIIIGAIVLVGAIAAAGYFYTTRNQAHTQNNPEPIDTAKTEKPVTYPRQDDTHPADTGPTHAKAQPGSKPGTNSASGDGADAAPAPANGVASVTMASYSQKNHQVTTVVSLTGHSTSSTCTFTFSQTNTKPVIRQVQASGNTCTATAPEVEFSAVGLWRLHVSLNNGATKLAETYQHVTIN